jgi:hypothetical protein
MQQRGYSPDGPPIPRDENEVGKYCRDQDRRFVKTLRRAILRG